MVDRPLTDKRPLGPFAQRGGGGSKSSSDEDFVLVFQFKEDKHSPLGTDEFTFEGDKHLEGEVRDIIEDNIDGVEYLDTDGRSILYVPYGARSGGGYGKSVVVWSYSMTDYSTGIQGIQEDLEESNIAAMPSLASLTVSTDYSEQ